ncbi:MAG: protein kinase [Symploca sp. SIO1B1]|nr:protein kinase [Symploca sp. SIO1B1]
MIPIPLNPIIQAITPLAGSATSLLKNKLERNEQVIKLLKKFHIDPEHPPADFTGVYKYTLVEYGVGKPQPILELFREKDIQQALHQALYQDDRSLFLKEAEQFLDWNRLGDKIRELRIDPRREFYEFAAIFIEIINRTQTPAEVIRTQKLDSLHKKLSQLQERLDKLPSAEEICTEIAQLVQEKYSAGLPQENIPPTPATLSSPTAPTSLTVGGRYKIIQQLGNGEFGDTYLAEDLHFPSKPRCVIKQLRSQCSQTARRSFDREAKVLYQLNSHDQIPNLLAHFEDGDFYLVHQFIEGQTLSHELIDTQPWSNPQVINMLQDILQILAFIHQHQVIHRHINPKNLIRRSSDNKIVLINFGGIKEISTGQTRTFAETQTEGYMPPEQGSGLVRFCSDIYAVGIIGIQAITGLNPKQFKLNGDGDIVWHDKVQISPKFADILDKMVRYNFKVRYQSAADALQALLDLEASEQFG